MREYVTLAIAIVFCVLLAGAVIAREEVQIRIASMGGLHLAKKPGVQLGPILRF